uniref:Uncharacterized protein n=1 Tax=Takifugu rubripes TaxID=31033 RepID=A0A3B5KAZ1_TAKRU
MRQNKSSLTYNSTSSRHNPVKIKKERKPSGPRVFVRSGYQQPTVSSTTRTLSPYTHRKMCQLSEDSQQRLRHLQLGPHHFRKETESQQPFLVGITRSDQVDLGSGIDARRDLHIKGSDFCDHAPWEICI